MFELKERLLRVPAKVWLLLSSLVISVGVVILVVGITIKNNEAPGPVVRTHCGKVQGTTTSTSGTHIHEFLYIPYGVPPVGERRWEHSSLLEDCWDGVYKADTDRDIRCVQKLDPVVGTEDCLYLSVRSPDLQEKKLPVIVWIHGGSLTSGFAEDPGYSADSDFTAAVGAVTVNINYRLDLLGFLAHPALWEDGQSYGNFGMTDALVALKWVQANIANFGGDPARVTIMGESSGGTLVLGLVTSPKAKGLFKRAISLSTPPLWKATYEIANQGRPDFLEKVSCGGLDSDEATRSCLKQVSVEALRRYSDNAYRGWGFYDFPMSQGKGGESMDYNVQEPYFLPYLPQDIADEADDTDDDIELILSNTAQEVGYSGIFYDQPVAETWEEADELLKNRIKKLYDGEDKLDLVASIKTEYNFGKDTDDWWPQMFWDTLTTDIRATCPSNDLTKRLNTSPHLKVYRMYIAHRASPELCGGQRWTAWHGWDTEAMFGYKYYRIREYYDTVTDHDLAFRDDLRKLVKGFAEKGGSWSTEDTIYFTNNLPLVKVTADSPQSEHCQFWEDTELNVWGWQN